MKYYTTKSRALAHLLLQQPEITTHWLWLTKRIAITWERPDGKGGTR